jgi:homoserine kinase type II
MAVYTTLTRLEIHSLLQRFNLPGLQAFQGSSSGIENTTYFLTLETGFQYVLTVFETLSTATLAPYIQLLTQLNSRGLPVPCPCVDKHGSALQNVAGKPALLFHRAPGKHIDNPTYQDCHAVGAVLAMLHSATSSTAFEQQTLPNPCGLAWMKETLAFVQSSLDPADIKILHNQITLSAELESRKLPRGIIHGDLFRDNVLMEDGQITAVIDFYNAGQDVLLLDMAVAANDWCYARNENHIDAFLDGYRCQRPLNPSETGSWTEYLQVAAARLWLSRLKRLVLSRQGHKGAVKSPDEYKLLLLQHLSAQN